MNDLLIFVMEGYNRYSIAALAGILDQERPDLRLEFWQGRADLGERVRQAATHHRHVVVAFSFMSPQLPQILPVLEGLHSLPANVTLVAGGPHASGEPESTLRLGFQAVVTGEGEVTFPCCWIVFFVGETSFEGLTGIAYLDNTGKFSHTRRGPWVDLDAYPPFSIKHRKLAAIEITRDVPGLVAFARRPFLWGPDALPQRRANSLLVETGAGGSGDALCPLYQRRLLLLRVARWPPPQFGAGRTPGPHG